MSVPRAHRYCNETMVLQDGRLAIAQALCDFLPFFAIQHHAAEVRIYRVAFVESQAVLSHHIELAAEY